MDIFCVVDVGDILYCCAVRWTGMIAVITTLIYDEAGGGKKISKKQELAKMSDGISVSNVLFLRYEKYRYCFQKSRYIWLFLSRVDKLGRFLILNRGTRETWKGETTDDAHTQFSLPSSDEMRILNNRVFQKLF